MQLDWIFLVENVQRRPIKMGRFEHLIVYEYAISDICVFIKQLFIYSYSQYRRSTFHKLKTDCTYKLF